MIKTPNYRARFKKTDYAERWAVTEAKVRIRQALARNPWSCWHFVSFSGPDGGESRGVVDLVAIRKDHGSHPAGLNRGDRFQIILIQTKGGYAANPTGDDVKRLRAVARHHRAQRVLLAKWMKGKAARFFSLRPKTVKGKGDWVEVTDLKTAFS